MKLFGDLEANGLLEEATKIHCAVFKDMDTGELYRFNPKNIDHMCSWLDKNATVLIFHNGTTYDFPLMKKIYNWEFKGTRVDTLLISRVLNPKRILPPHCPNRRAGPHSIEAWGYRVGRGKPEYNEWDEYDEEMLHRCTEDVEILALVFKALMDEARGHKWRDAFLLTQELFTNLQEQESYGWHVDVDYMKWCIHQLDRWINLIDKVLVPKLPSVLEIKEIKKNGEYSYCKPFTKAGKYTSRCVDYFGIDNVGCVVGPFSRISFRKVNLDSNMETKDYLLSQGWKPLEWNYDDEGRRRSPKMSKEDTFEGINSKVGKLIARRVQCRQRKSIIEGLLKITHNSKIGSSVASLAATGRAMHRNIVNIPHAGSFYGKQMRKIFSHRTGKCLVGVDSDACQIRMLASRMGDDDYMEAVCSGKKENGTDMHTVNQKKAGLATRDQAKTFFYAYLFGAGDPKLGKSLGVSTEEAGKTRKRFDDSFPALVALRNKLEKEWRKNHGHIIGLDGRPIKVESEHQLLVYLLQSDEAIYMSHVYNNICRELKGICHPLAWYHDEVNVECNPEDAEYVKKRMEEIFFETGKQLNIKCPLPGSGKIGYNWYDIH